MTDENRQRIDYDDVKTMTKEDAARATPFSVRWFRGESIASIAQAEGLDAEAVEALIRTTMKGIHVVSRTERDEAREKALEYVGEVRRLRRLAAHVAKGGFGAGAMLTFVVDECANGLRFQRFVITAPTLDEAQIAEAFRPNLEATLARVGEVAKVRFEMSGVDDVLDEEIEGAPSRGDEADAEGGAA